MKRFKLSLAAITILVAAFSARSLVHAQTGPKHVDVIANQFTFSPAEITLKKGQPVTLVLKSMDTNHGLRFRELNVDVKANKGQSGEVTFTPDKTGDFTGHCSVFCGRGHGTMSLTLHVVE